MMFYLIGFFLLFVAIYVYKGYQEETIEKSTEQKHVHTYKSTMTVNNVDYYLHYKPSFEPEVLRTFEIISDSVSIINTSKNLETIASRYGVLEQQCENLKRYSSSVEEANSFSSGLSKVMKSSINKKVISIIEVALIKSKNAKTKRGKISPIEKVLTLLELNKEVVNAKNYADMQDKLTYVLDYIEAQDLDDKANKYDFKGNTKKAEEMRKELEYFLLTAHPKLRKEAGASNNYFENDTLLLGAS